MIFSVSVGISNGETLEKPEYFKFIRKKKALSFLIKLSQNLLFIKGKYPDSDKVI